MSTAAVPILAAPSYLELVREFPLRPLRTKSDYDRASAILDRLAVCDEDDLDQGESDYLETLSILIEEYDREHYPMPSRRRSPLETLKFLLKQNKSLSD